MSASIAEMDLGLEHTDLLFPVQDGTLSSQLYSPFPSMDSSAVLFSQRAEYVHPSLQRILESTNHRFEQSLEIISAQIDPDEPPIRVLHTAEEMRAIRGEFSQRLHYVVDNAVASGQNPNIAFAMIGALPLAQDALLEMPQYADRFHPSYMITHFIDGRRDVIPDTVAFDRTDGPTIFVDHVTRSGLTIARWIQTLPDLSIPPEDVSQLIERIIEKQQMTSEFLTEEMNLLAQFLERENIILALPFSKNEVLLYAIEKRTHQVDSFYPWAEMQSRMLQGTVILDEYCTPLGGSMWDIPLPADELRTILPVSTHPRVDALGIGNIDILRLGGRIPHLLEIRFEDYQVYKEWFAQQLAVMIE